MPIVRNIDVLHLSVAYSSYPISDVVGENMLITLIITLVVIGLLIWLVDMLPIDAQIKLIIRVISIVAAIIWLLQILLGGGTLPLFRM